MKLSLSLWTDTPFLRYWRRLSLILGRHVPLNEAWRTYAKHRRA